MASAGVYFGIVLTSLGAFFTTAQAGEDFQQKARSFFTRNDPEEKPLLNSRDVTSGLKSTLSLAANHAVQKLGRYDGFASNPETRIPLPPNFQKARDVLDRFGLSARLDDLELKMNRAAEDATPSLKPEIDKAIDQLTFKDGVKIATGPENAATNYFRAVSDADLRKKIQPVIAKSLVDSGAQNTIKIINQSMNNLPIQPDIKFDMNAYVAEKTLAGIYFYMAEKEKNIRRRPSSSGNEAIKKLFSN